MWVTLLGFVQFCLTWLCISLLLKLPEKHRSCLGWQGGLGWCQCARCFRVAAVDQLCVAHTVVCALSFSSLMTPKMQSVKGIAGIVALLSFPGAYSAYVLVLFLLLWDSALSCTLCMVFSNWGCLSRESLLTYYQHSVSVLECTPQPRNDLWLGTSVMH